MYGYEKMTRAKRVPHTKLYLSSDSKLCVHCKHHEHATKMTGYRHLCHKTASISLVTGNRIPADCEEQRQYRSVGEDAGMCGSSGRYWEGFE